MKFKLTKKQIEILKYLDENDQDIIVNGNEAWYGINKTNVRMVYSLVRLVLISEDGYLSGHYNINSTGIEAYKQEFVELPNGLVR